MAKVYLDNSATSYPKAPGVGDAIKEYIENVGSNINRSGYQNVLSGEEMVFETREFLCDLFNFDIPENVIFTMNVTQSLNILLKGLLKAGDHCLVSSMEHNAVMRPLSQLTAEGVSFTRLMCNNDGQLDSKLISQNIKPNTKALIMTQSSNVCGTILPLEEVGSICQANSIIFIVDAAQTAGALPIDIKALKADALAFTGHKSLLGPQGTGGFVIKKELADSLNPLLSGGTGSLSECEQQPAYMPDKFEGGTMNLPGLAGLHQALIYLKKVGLAAITTKEKELTHLLLQGLNDIKPLQIIGLNSTEGRMPVISINCPNHDNAEVAYHLDKHYGIRTRCGLHCAPSAHKTLSTFPLGTVRFSPGFFNTKEEIEYTIASLTKTLKELHS